MPNLQWDWQNNANQIGDNSMPKIIVNAFLTMDGVMQAPGGPDEDNDGGFEHGG